MPGDWSSICPAGAPERVETVRAAALDLRQRVPAAREAVNGAKAGFAAAEDAAVRTRAAALREGSDARPDEDAIAAARAQLDDAERELAALQLAIEESESELGRVVAQERGRWREEAAKAQTRARRAALAAVDRLEASITELHNAQLVEQWLRHGGRMDAQRPPGTIGLGTLPGSERATANQAQLATGDVLGWLRELVDPAPAPEAVGHRADRWPVTGARAVG